MAALRPETTTGWGAFAAWAACGMLWAFSFLSFAGLFTLPLAVLMTALNLKHAPDRRDAIGLIAGVAVLLLVIGFMNLGYQACPDGPVTIMSDEGSFSCGGFDPRPWFAVGFVLFVASLSVYRISRRGVVG